MTLYTLWTLALKWIEAYKMWITLLFIYSFLQRSNVNSAYFTSLIDVIFFLNLFTCLSHHMMRPLFILRNYKLSLKLDTGKRCMSRSQHRFLCHIHCVLLPWLYFPFFEWKNAVEFTVICGFKALLGVTILLVNKIIRAPQFGIRMR